MQGKKWLLAEMLYWSCGLRLLQFLGRRLVVVNYHRIAESGVETEFDEGTFGPSEAVFEDQVRWLATNTDTLSEADLLGCLASGTALPRRTSLITFDDGYIDNYKLAFPILRRLSVPAIFFIPSLPIETRKLGWWDIIAYLLKRTERDEVAIRGRVFRLRDGDGRKRAIRFALRTMSGMAADLTRTFIEDLAAECRVEQPPIERQSAELMSWEQIRHVAAKGIAIGAHTHSHRVLSTLDEREQENELKTSKSIIEAKLGARVRSLAYPVGLRASFTSRTKELARQCGYEAAFSFYAGMNDPAGLDLLDIRRIPPAGSMSVFMASAVLPRVFSRA